MIDKIIKYFSPKNDSKPIEYTYFQMVDYLKNHYRYEWIIIGQMDEEKMARKLSNMSFDELKTLFKHVLRIEDECYSLNKTKRSSKWLVHFLKIEEKINKWMI